MLGRIAVVRGGHETDLGTSREASLLADLLVHANHVVATNRLIDDLWAGEPPPSSRATLHSHIRNLRRLLEPHRRPGEPSSVLVTCRPGYVLRVDEDAVDSWYSERLIAEGRSALAAGDSSTARDLLAAGLAGWDGRPFGEVADEPHLRAIAARLDEARLRAVEDRIEADLALGGHAELCGELEMLTAEHPYRERLWEHWMLALYRSGRQVHALEAFQRLRRTLDDELGIEPGASVRALEEAIILQKPDLGPPADAERRLLGNVARPAAPLSARTSFVGREAELAELVALLQGPTASLVMVTGPPGIGKTRLALEAATRGADRFGGGACLVGLGSVLTPEAVPDVVLSALGGRRQARRSTLESLGDLAGAGRWLVVLDNCEHVLDAAAGCVDAIVANGASVVLATSRQPLGMVGERLFPVAPLAPEAAVDLFVDRAEAAAPDFVRQSADAGALDEVCARLDRLPLAIELAAVRVRLMSVRELADRLDERFRVLQGARGAVARHHTLDAAVRWSYDLLEARQRAVFDRLCVFAGGFLRGAAVDVCGDGTVSDLDAVEILDALVVRSMVHADSDRAITRYSLLETMREFGREQLAVEEMRRVRARHARHYLVVAEQARQQMSTPEGASGVATFAAEWDNLRVAFEWAIESGDVDVALRLVIAAFWYAQEGFHHELLDWAERALALAGALEHDLWPAAAGVTSLLLRSTGDVERERLLAEQAVERERKRGSPRRFEPALALWSYHWVTGHYDEAAELLPDVLHRGVAGGDPVELARARYLYAITYVITRMVEIGTVDDDAVRDAEQSRVPFQLANAYTGKLAVELQRDRSSAPELFAKARRWSELAGTRMLYDNAALWMADAGCEDEPLEALAFARLCIVDTSRSGYWGNFEMVLRPAVRALVQVGRCHSAALLLGGLLALPGTRDESAELTAVIEPVIRDALGERVDALLADGKRLDRRGLADLVLAEIDEVLGPSTA